MRVVFTSKRVHLIYTANCLNLCICVSVFARAFVCVYACDGWIKRAGAVAAAAAAKTIHN